MITVSAFRWVPGFAQGQVRDRLAASVARCTARPAFRRALDAQLADFRLAA
jgi:hypothetical protein